MFLTATATRWLNKSDYGITLTIRQVSKQKDGFISQWVGCAAQSRYTFQCARIVERMVLQHFQVKRLIKQFRKFIYAKVWLHTKGSLLRSESVYMTKVCAKLSKNTNICGSLVCFLVTHQNEMKWSDCVHSFLSHPSSFSRQKC